MDIKTEFQRRIDPNRSYSGSELRQLVLDCFQAGRQSSREGFEPVRDVKFQGLAFVDDSGPRNQSLGNYDQLYAETQFSDGTREGVLERLIPDEWYGSGCWIRIVEMEPDPTKHSSTTSTTFDYANYFPRGYHLRK